MEKADLKLIQLYHDDFYKAYITRDQFSSIPSLRGIKLSLELEKRPSDYVCFYATNKFLNAKLEYSEEEEIYFVDDYELEPDFYIRGEDLNRMEDI